MSEQLRKKIKCQPEKIKRLKKGKVCNTDSGRPIFEKSADKKEFFDKKLKIAGNNKKLFEATKKLLQKGTKPSPLKKKAKPKTKPKTKAKPKKTKVSDSFVNNIEKGIKNWNNKPEKHSDFVLKVRDDKGQTSIVKRGTKAFNNFTQVYTGLDWLYSADCKWVDKIREAYTKLQKEGKAPPLPTPSPPTPTPTPPPKKKKPKPSHIIREEQIQRDIALLLEEEDDDDFFELDEEEPTPVVVTKSFKLSTRKKANCLEHDGITYYGSKANLQKLARSLNIKKEDINIVGCTAATLPAKVEDKTIAELLATIKPQPTPTDTGITQSLIFSDSKGKKPKGNKASCLNHDGITYFGLKTSLMEIADKLGIPKDEVKIYKCNKTKLPGDLDEITIDDILEKKVSTPPVLVPIPVPLSPVSPDVEIEEVPEDIVATDVVEEADDEEDLVIIPPEVEEEDLVVEEEEDLVIPPEVEEEDIIIEEEKEEIPTEEEGKLEEESIITDEALRQVSRAAQTRQALSKSSKVCILT